MTFRYPWIKLVVWAVVGVLVAGGLAVAISSSRGNPQIVSTTLEEKVSSNGRFSVTFNHVMLPGSVRSAFSISPEVKGKLKWRGRTFSFIPEDQFVLQTQTYTLAIKEDARDIFGRKLGEDFTSEFIVVEPPKVILAAPTVETDPESKITVMFDRPMVALTNLDEAEKHFPPMTIEPKVEGKFRWVGTSAVQFVPKDRLQYSTHYTVTLPKDIESADGGKTTEEYRFEFNTPRLELKHVGEPRYPDKVLWLSFNQEVDLDSINGKVRLYLKDGPEVPLSFDYGTKKEYENKDGKRVGKTVENKKVVDIRPKSGAFLYSQGYWLEIDTGIKGKEGNLASETERRQGFSVSSFLEHAEPQCKGACASPRPEITFRFHEEVDLGSILRNFAITPEVNLAIAYGKKCDPEWKPEGKKREECPLIDNKEVAILTPKEALPNNASYHAALQVHEVENKKGVKPQGNKESFEWDFTVASLPEISAHFIKDNSYREFCFYSNNALDEEKLKEALQFTPEYTKKEREDKRDIYVNSYQPQDGKNRYRGSCRQMPEYDPLWATLVRVLLNPDTDYTVTVPGTVTDVFDQRLGKDYSFQYRTAPMKDEDTFLTRRQRESFAVATEKMSIPVVFETKNLTELTLTLCRLSPEKYIEVDTEDSRKQNVHYLDRGWNAFVPSSGTCEFYRQWTQKVPQRFWNPAFTQLDVRKLLGSEYRPGLYYLMASSPKVYKMQASRYYSEEEKRWVTAEKRKIFTRPFIVISFTDTHLAVKRANDKILTWATGLSDGQPKAGVDLAFYNGKGERVLSSTSVTGGDGIFTRAADNPDFEFIVGRKGDDVALVRNGWSEGIGTWDFGVAGDTLREGVVGYVYTDRPLYRPGHTVYFKGILRDEYDASFTIPPNKKVRVRVEKDNEIYNKEIAVLPNGTFNGELTLEGNAPLGYYNIQVTDVCDKPNKTCKQIFAYGSFEVEEYRKPEYKTEIKFDREFYVNRETLGAQITGEYFFGAPVLDGTVAWSITSQDYYFDEYRDEWFSFSDSDYSYGCYGECPYEDNLVAQGEAKLDAVGHASVSHPITLHKSKDGKEIVPKTSKLYTLQMTLSDANNQSVYDSESVVVHRGEFYVGVRSEEYVAKEGENSTFTVIAVDQKGNPLSGKSIETELVQVEWKSVKKMNVDGTFYWENEKQENVVGTQTVKTGDKGKAQVRFAVPKGGEYRIRAKATDSKGNQMVSSAGFWASSYSYINWRRENHNRMEITTDKTEYKVGEVAKVLVRSPYNDVKALYTLERGSIMEAKVIDISSNAQVIEVPITEKMIPNVFISILEVRKELSDESPDFKMGYVNIPVNTEPKNLFISIETDKERYHPSDTVHLTVKTENLKREPVRANLSIAVIDESLLALKGNPKKDLISIFYNRHGVGVRTSSSLVRLLERVSLKTEEGSKGGGGGGETAFHYRGEFKDTAHFSAQMTTNEKGEATLEFKLPENLTTWVIEAVGVTDDSLVGVAERTVTSGKDVIVRPVLPRFVRATDVPTLGAIVHNFTGERQTFDVDIETEVFSVRDRKRERLTLDPDESKKLTWVSEVPQGTVGKEAVVRVKAVAGNFSDGVEIKLPILSYSSPEAVATSGVTEDQSTTERVSLSAEVDRTQGSLTITTAPTVANFVPSSLEYLFRFPYASNEGTISTMVPLMTLKSALRIPNLEQVITIPEIKGPDGKKYTLEQLVNISLQRLYRTQRHDGGWGYWDESRESNAYLTAYMLYGLNTIKEAGYSVDQAVMNRAVDFIRNYMKSNRDLENGRKKTQWWADNRAYFLYVLSETGQGDLGLALNLWDDEELLSTFGRLNLLMTFTTHREEVGAQSRTGDTLTKNIKRLTRDIEARARIDARGTYIEPTDYNYHFLLTRRKATAITIQALTRSNIDHPLLPRLIVWLVRSRENGHWSSTNETAASLVALTEYLEKSRETEARYHATVSLAGKAIAEYDVNAENIFKTQTTEVPVSTFRDDTSQSVVFKKDGTGKLYYEMLLKYYLPILKLEPRSQGLTLSREYFRLDDKKMENPVLEAKAGETLRGKLTIVLGEERHFVTAEVPLPAGFELVNFQLATADQRLQELEGFERVDTKRSKGYPWCYCGGAYWEHKELRDDRLFLFAERLSPGVYEYTYLVQATTPGVFAHPPAAAFETYFPENFGRTAGELFKVSSEPQ